MITQTQERIPTETHLVFYLGDPMKNPKSTWTLPKLFKWWSNEARTTRSRKRPKETTIKNHGISVARWVETMATKKRPKGPKLCEIDQETLALFWSRLADVTYNRGGGDRQITEVTRHGRFASIEILLAAAGPYESNRIRANVLDRIPRLHIDKPVSFPKDTWELDEARLLAAAIDEFTPPEWHGTIEHYRNLARAWVALLYYTGHRAQTYTLVRWRNLIEYRPGLWRIEIERSMKTGKPARIEVHPQLLLLLQRLGPGEPDDVIINWPFGYRTFYRHFHFWQDAAGLPKDRHFSPQGFRRLNAQVMVDMGVQQAQSAASNSLGHSSSAVTTGHYADAAQMLLRSMPELFAIDSPVLEAVT